MTFWNYQAVTWKYRPVIEKGERDLVIENQARGHLAASDLTKETRLMLQIFTGTKRFRSFTRNFLIAKTIRFMIVNQADRLHERVADRRAHELEPALQEITTQRVRIGSILLNARESPHYSRTFICGGPSGSSPCITWW